MEARVFIAARPGGSGGDNAIRAERGAAWSAGARRLFSSCSGVGKGGRGGRGDDAFRWWKKIVLLGV